MGPARPTIHRVDEVLLAAEPDELRPLLSALAAAGAQYVLVERAAEVEQAVRAGRAGVVVVSPLLCEKALRGRLRRHHPDRPLVGWLARSSTSDAADLLEEGAADVLDATMGPRELLVRLRHAAHRPDAAAETLERGPLTIDPVQGTAYWSGLDLALTRREREVVHVLAESAGRVVRREEIYRRVWGFAMARGDRTVDVNVKRIRAKLAAAGASAAIGTQPGVGYRLELPAGKAVPAVTGS